MRDVRSRENLPLREPLNVWYLTARRRCNRQSKKIFPAFFFLAMSEEMISYEERPIPRRSARELTTQEFHECYFAAAIPVVITDATSAWPASQWTIESLKQRVGKNEVWIRGRTDQVSSTLGRKHEISCIPTMKGFPRYRPTIATASATPFGRTPLPTIAPICYRAISVPRAVT